LSPAGDLAEDEFGIGGPDEGFGRGVVVLEIAVDRGLEIDAQPAPAERREDGAVTDERDGRS
jgi:hypothetical protein